MSAAPRLPHRWSRRTQRLALLTLAVAALVPLDRILIETDSPYLAPIPMRGKRNEPAYVIETARRVGELRSLTQQEIGRITAENFLRFFNLEIPTENAGR